MIKARKDSDVRKGLKMKKHQILRFNEKDFDFVRNFSSAYSDSRN